MANAAIPTLDFAAPAGAAALFAPDSVHWRVYKNPVSLFIGGITAVLLELAEPRVRTGVWGHSIFPEQPLLRMQRTGFAAMATVYGPADKARKVIAGVVRMHDKVAGVTPCGKPYRANDPDLLDWVQLTATFGFMEAYAVFVAPLSLAEKDACYAEARISGPLYGAHNTPASVAEQVAMFDRWNMVLVDHPIVHDFLAIVRKVPALPYPLRLMQPMLVRASISLLPAWLITRLGLDGETLGPTEARLIRFFGRLSERMPIKSAPPAQASVRVGRDARFLYRTA
jgi:uncharacterized protein (DUF2236 family)